MSAVLVSKATCLRLRGDAAAPTLLIVADVRPNHAPMANPLADPRLTQARLVRRMRSWPETNKKFAKSESWGVFVA
jgi:hypothetical protein